MLFFLLSGRLPFNAATVKDWAPKETREPQAAAHSRQVPLGSMHVSENFHLLKLSCF